MCADGILKASKALQFSGVYCLGSVSKGQASTFKSIRSRSGRSKGKGFFRRNENATEDNCHTVVRSRIASMPASGFEEVVRWVSVPMCVCSGVKNLQ